MSHALRWLYQDERRTGAYREGGVVAGADIASLRVLVVDDLPIHRQLLSGMLNVLFPRSVVESACDGVQAQAMLREQQYDIVLSDWVMPGMDGLQLADWLRSCVVPQRLFVLFSAHDVVAEIEALFPIHGIDGYLIKPFDPDAIREMVLLSARALVSAA